MTKKITPISICVIMKNEEKHMDQFLSAIVKGFQNYPYELVLVDTGSTDRTLEIAEKYPCKIYHFDWINDFSAARNFSLSCAENDWILVLDCDEYLTEADPSVLHIMIEKSACAFVVYFRKKSFPCMPERGMPYIMTKCNSFYEVKVKP